jgi:CDP-paratose 2-epimerase
MPLEGTRSLYGATKLCSELILQEYIEMYGIRAVINRCGVLTGPWQMGKVDQGFVVLWVAKHVFGGELSYFGYGGNGKQVRDVLHVDDLFHLLLKQHESMDRHNGMVYNIGGGHDISLSLCELTELCQHVTRKKISIKGVAQNRVADIPYYVTDHARVTAATDWQPRIDRGQIIEEIAQWIIEQRGVLEPLLS